MGRLAAAVPITASVGLGFTLRILNKNVRFRAQRWVAYQDEVGHRVGRVGGGVEAEMAAVAGEADAERHLARRRGGEVAHG